MSGSYRTLLPLCLVLICVAAVVEAANYGEFNGGVAIGTGYAGVYTAPTNGLLVQGNVGIGTTSPGSALTMGTGQIAALPGTASAPGYSFVGNLNVGFSVSSGNLFTDVGGAVIGDYWSGGYTLNDNKLLGWANLGVTTTDTDISRLSNAVLAIGNGTQGDYSGSLIAGKIGIANSSPSTLLHVGSSSASGVVAELQNSSGACTHTPGSSSETVSCSSDERFKRDIQDTKNALGWLEQLRVRDFIWKPTGEHRTGVVAQELKEQHPEMVHKTAEGSYLVDQPNPWMLVKAIQEQQGAMREQQREIDELRQTIKQLKSTSP